MSRILVIDDNGSDREHFRRLLGPEHDVVEAGTVHRALDILEEAPMDCVLLDQRLPGGEGTGRMLRPGLTYLLPAGAYLLKARKRVYTLTPILPRAREKPAVIGGLVKPTTRTQA